MKHSRVPCPFAGNDVSSQRKRFAKFFVLAGVFFQGSSFRGLLKVMNSPTQSMVIVTDSWVDFVKVVGVDYPQSYCVVPRKDRHSIICFVSKLFWVE